MFVPTIKIFYKLKNVCFDDVVSHFYQERDPSSLGIIRLSFGLLMMLDLPEERGGSDIFVRYGNPQDCHFPLFDFMKPLNYEWMSVLYGIMWLGAVGIMLGFQFRISVLMFIAPYWYIFLLDKSFWNNHTYLYGIIATLLIGTSANNYCSVDSLLSTNIRNRPVPYWNYFILKFQFFMLYFLAGLKKTDWEWLEGYAMNDMGNHWVFFPFRLLLTPTQIDYIVIHWFGFILDLTIGFWMVIEFTRPIAMVFCALFHLMNSRMFSIGMFPYVCLATMPLFCRENWPRRLSGLLSGKKYQEYYRKRSSGTAEIKPNITLKKRIIVCLLLGHCTLQTVLPFSHSITKNQVFPNYLDLKTNNTSSPAIKGAILGKTKWLKEEMKIQYRKRDTCNIFLKGYNNWTKGLYGYSWDMMIHGWDTILVVVKVFDKDTGQEHFLDSTAWSLNDRWTKHADMCLQYAQCVEKNLAASKLRNISNNISIYIDVWCSMNGRIQQRMFNPNYDLLKANWSVFQKVEWLLPLISEYSSFREKIKIISDHVYSWSNFSEVVFVSDFPGLYLENYIAEDLKNVSLTILEGEVLYESETPDEEDSSVFKLIKGASKSLYVGQFHRIHSIGENPSCFMYTYINSTKKSTEAPLITSQRRMYSPFPLIEDINHKIESSKKMFSHIYVGFQHVLKYYQ